MVCAETQGPLYAQWRNNHSESHLAPPFWTLRHITPLKSRVFLFIRSSGILWRWSQGVSFASSGVSSCGIMFSNTLETTGHHPFCFLSLNEWFPLFSPHRPSVIFPWAQGFEKCCLSKNSIDQIITKDSVDPKNICSIQIAKFLQKQRH